MALFVTCIGLIVLIIIQSELHRRQMNDLMNRFMARNLTEYQTGKEKKPIERSENSNYFLDSLNRAYKSKTLDE